MTRSEHIQWCKDRAIAEFDYYAKHDPSNAARNGIKSMISDLGKHEKTKSEMLDALCLREMMKSHTRASFMEFIDGFN